MMKIERFQEEDMNVVKPLAKQAWHTFYDGFSEDYLLCIAECIVRHNFTDADLSLKISDEEGVKGLIFGTRKGKIVDLSDWVKKQSENLSPIEKDLLETLCEYMDEADRNTLARMSDEDVKLSLFVSTRKGCGRELLNAITEEFRKHRFRKMFLWTDTSCDHDYYPTHGFTLATTYRDRHYSTEEKDYMTYIYWKPIL
ncbi:MULTISPECIES: hypothetical protein [Bacteroidaceae]|uniref:hypothetical protein n=1 Tax=Bacteroidaceae TaxID=815 RepID=UPI001EF702A5|nr:MULTISPECIES: hypothetical protein [Bacteroidaceae]